MRELLARVKAILRRVRVLQEKREFKSGSQRFSN